MACPDVGFGLRTRHGSTGAEREAHTFSALLLLARHSHAARDGSGPDHGYQPISRRPPTENQDRLSAWCLVTSVPRSQPCYSARAGNCQVLMQWKLQAMEAVAVQGRAVPRLRRHTHATFPRAGIWYRRRDQKPPDQGEPSRPRDTVLQLSCLKKSKIVLICTRFVGILSLSRVLSVDDPT